MKITVVGMGYVGTSNAFLFSEKHDVICYDIDENKIEKLEKSEVFNGTNRKNIAYDSPDWIFICVPTDFDKSLHALSTKIIDSVLDDIQHYSPGSNVVIKSTVPIGYTKKMIEKTGLNIMFSPEFLREGTEISDNLFPDRIVIGSETVENMNAIDTTNSSDYPYMVDILYEIEKADELAKMMVECSMLKRIPIYFCTTSEAEASKLLSNTYLAMRVAFFNEVSTFCTLSDFHTKNVIENICSDKRIGNHYNNPSFGYGGYCLPKDSKEIEQHLNKKDTFDYFPLLTNISYSNYRRKIFAISHIKKYISIESTIGVYSLSMKSGSDNSRESAIIDLILNLQDYNIIICDDEIDESFLGLPVYRKKNFNEFLNKSDLIISNRIEDKIKNIEKPVFSFDIFGTN